MIDLSKLTLRQKIAQMFVVAGRDIGLVDRMISEGAGGIWPNGYPDRVNGESFRDEIAGLQKKADIGMFIAADLETGCGQLIGDGSCTEFPSLMAFGALGSVEGARLAYEAGCVVAEESQWLGVNISFSPVFDVNTVAENPISNTRSVSDDHELVAQIAIAYAKGMASTGKLLPLAKHFPGEGMHRKDPHFCLEFMHVSEEEMYNVHLAAFAKGFEGGIEMIMTNHAIYPALDERYPCTLSKNILTVILRNEMGFDGLVITDAMEMKGIVEKFSFADSLILAVNAGNDLLLGPCDPLTGLDILVGAVNDGLIKPETIDRAVKRIIRFKKKIGLIPCTVTSLQPESPIEQRKAVSNEISRKSITMFKNQVEIIPVKDQASKKVLVLEPEHPVHQPVWALHFNIFGLTEFVEKEFKKADTVLFSAYPDQDKISEIIEKAKDADLILASTFFRSRAGQTGLLTQKQVEMFRQVDELGKPVVYVASNPYVVAEIDFAETVLISYGSNQTSIGAVVDVLLGRVKPQGQLPVKLPEYLDPAGVEIIAHDD